MLHAKFIIMLLLIFSACSSESKDLKWKYVTVNTYLFEGSNFSYHDSQFAFAQNVYEQAKIKLVRGKVIKVNLRNSDLILGYDLLLEAVSNESELLAINGISSFDRYDINAYYVLALTAYGSLDGTASGIMISENSIVMTSLSNGRTLAHEIGHSLLGPGHEVPDSTYLMYYKNLGGIKLSHKEITRMRRSEMLRNKEK